MTETNISGMDTSAAAAALPDLILLQVIGLLPAADVVSIGQVCRHWRRVALGEEVWRRRELDATCDEADGGRQLVRVLRFAPCLAGLSVATTSWSSPRHAARAAVKQALLQADCKVERITDVWCHVDGEWASAMLAVHADHVREVGACHVDGALLQALHTMALHRALRGLQVWHGDVALRVQDDDLAFDEEDGEGRGQGGLQWVDIFDIPQATTLSLLRAHRRTLQEVTLHVGTPAPSAVGWGWRHQDDRWPDTCSRLHLQLSACSLQALQSLFLDRYGRSHPLPACAAQLADLRGALPGVTVTCLQCEEDAKSKKTSGASSPSTPSFVQQPGS
ncbi:uncharacterized protein LOC113205394 [Frankliniella occidentalis]|uniref:Uncharacterized protein LOC113205394 n=1 Tax=Frankliniella occidentalis TaxID=133901 RepID=A0A6J1SC10_FRAOC|nr:uncharacterized protein LOC113205394 [Frankliniella occidentalis]